MPELPLDGNQTATGATEPPASPPSQSQGQLSQEQIKAILDNQARLEQQIKGIQKGTDKQIGQVRSDVKRILELRERGLDETQIQRELFVDSLIEQGAQPKPVAGNDGAGQSLDADAVLKALNFPENDVALNALKLAYQNDKSRLVEEAAKLRLSQMTVPALTPATTLLQNSGTPPPPADQLAELRKEYEKKRQALADNKMLNPRSLSNLQDEFAAKGLNL
jgi:hypothetical protein